MGVSPDRTLDLEEGRDNSNSNSSTSCQQHRHNAESNPSQNYRQHLHQLMASPDSSVLTPSPNHHHNRIIERQHQHIVEEEEDKNPFDYALTQSVMRRLQKHLPLSKRGDSFWLQYSLIRDGASLNSLLDMVHNGDSHFTPSFHHHNNKTASSGSAANAVCSVLAVETVEGEVFGAFLTQTWRRSNNQWFGGGQSFLWTTCKTKTTATTNSDANAKTTKENRNSHPRHHLEIFPYSFANSYVQLCDRDRLLVGGGDGFGLALEKDLLRGSSQPCSTFSSPSLSGLHSDGSTFEIRNLEVWTLTPYLSMVENPVEGLTRVHRKDPKLCSKTITTTNTNKAKQRNINKENPALVSPDARANAHAHTNARIVVRNRNDRHHNIQRKKNRNKYLSP
mmetsp:Transcript_27261/g.57224  ORF Transcript_27261/g.57224 Transcript_27261/m.57224 type:complete len:392 (-) Transcript_27261:232-1407(-)